MDKVIIVPTMVLSVLLIVVYAIRCWYSGSAFSNAVMINIILQASGIVCAPFLAASLVFPEVKEIVKDLDLYIFISAVAVLAVSIQCFHRDAIKSTQKASKNESENSAQLQGEN